MFGDDTIIAPARVFCQKAAPATASLSNVEKTFDRTTFAGVGIGDFLHPDADDEQLILGTIIIVPRQLYIATKKHPSPVEGMRLDQVLTYGSGLDPTEWVVRVK